MDQETDRMLNPERPTESLAAKSARLDGEARRQGDPVTEKPKALTIRQPWADAITHQTKRTENRTWKTRYRGPILIHAASAHDPHAPLYGPRPDVRSAVLATARIADCHYSEDGQCCGPWGEGNVYHWMLADVTALREPVPCKGRLGLWTPDAGVLDAVIAQTAPAPAGS